MLPLCGVGGRMQMLVVLSGGIGHRGTDHLPSSYPTLGKFKSRSSHYKRHIKVST